MNSSDNFQLHFVSESQSFDISFQEQAHRSDDTVQINGRNYRLLGDSNEVSWLKSKLPELRKSDTALENLTHQLKKLGVTDIRTHSVVISTLGHRTEVEQKIDEYLLKAAKFWGFNGSVAVVHDGSKLKIQQGHGKVDPITSSNPETITGNTVFNLGSVTKYLTAIATMRLQEEVSTFNIDKPITKYLPRENLPTNPEVRAAWDKITIRHLLIHRSGLPNHMKGLSKEFQEAKEKVEGRALNPNEIIALVKEKPLTVDKPGDVYEYNNTAYILLGNIIQNVSGKSYGDYLKEAIFEKAEMKDSGLNSSKDSRKTDQVAIGWKEDTTNEILEAYSSGGAYSTSNDLIRLNEALQSGNILTTESLQELEEGVNQPTSENN